MSQVAKSHRLRIQSVNHVFPLLSITHKLCSDHETEFDVSEAGYASPHHHVAWRRVVGTGKIATKSGELREIGRKWFRPRSRVLFIRHKLVEQTKLQAGERQGRWSCLDGPVDHGHPEDSPTKNAKNGNQVHESFGGSQLCLFCSAARLQDFVEGLELPAQGVPSDLFQGIWREATGKSVISFQ